VILSSMSCSWCVVKSTSLGSLLVVVISCEYQVNQVIGYAPLKGAFTRHDELDIRLYLMLSHMAS
jgi:hypothetical protein